MEAISSVSTFFGEMAGVLGLSLPLLALAMIFLALRRMAAHSVLMHGSVSDPAPERARAASQSASWLYSFYLQNLEEVPFPGPFDIVIRGTPATQPEDVAQARTPLSVRVYAGPKVVTFLPDSNAGEDPRRYVYWRARFSELPAYDTWKFECRTSCVSTDFFVQPTRALELPDLKPMLLKPRLAVEARPSFLTLTARGKRRDYAGVTATPPYSVFGFVLAAVMLLYMSLVLVLPPEWLTIGDEWSHWSTFDWLALGCVVLIWTGFVLIRRPVHPIILGYLLDTKVQGAATIADKVEQR